MAALELLDNRVVVEDSAGQFVLLLLDDVGMGELLRDVLALGTGLLADCREETWEFVDEGLVFRGRSVGSRSVGDDGGLAEAGGEGARGT